MRRTTGAGAVILVSLLSMVVRPLARQNSAPPNPEVALRAAIELETVKGDLLAAIEAYKRLAQSQDKSIEAKALLHMGECYQKLGNAQAATTYEQLERDYSARPEAAEARTRLAALTAGSGRTPSGKTDRVVWTGGAAIGAAARRYTPRAVSPDGRWFVNEEYDSNSDILTILDLYTGTSRRLIDSRDNYWVSDVSISRDGKHVACWFADASDGVSELRIVDVPQTGTDPTSRVLLTSRSGVGQGYAGFEPYDWTADGQSILVGFYYDDHSQLGFVSTRDGSVRVVKTSPRELTAGRWPVGTTKLSPDDKYIAFDARHDDERVSLMAADGSGEVPAIVSRSNDRLQGWSPDSSRLIFTSDRTGTTGLYAQRVSNGRPQGAPEILTPEFGRTTILQTTVTGAMFYYPTPVAGDGGGIRTAAIDFSTGTVVSPPVDVLDDSGIGQITSPAFSPDGRFLAYAWVPTSAPPNRAQGETHLVIKNLASQVRRTANTALGRARSFVWAPDGSALAVYGSSNDGSSGIWRLDPVGGDMSPLMLADAGTDVSLHRWSADSMIVYLIRTRLASKEIALIEHNVASGIDRELFRGSNVQTPQLSPDGKTVYFRRVGAGKEPLVDVTFVARDLSTGDEREIAYGYLGGLALSPDGRLIATTATDPATVSRSIRLIPVAGGQARDVIRLSVTKQYLDGRSTLDPFDTSSPHTSVGPIFAWAPDSQSVLVQGPSLLWAPINGRSEAKAVDLGPMAGLGAGGGEGALRAYYADFSINRDGRRIVFLGRASRPTAPARTPFELHVLEHFLPGGK